MTEPAPVKFGALAWTSTPTGRRPRARPFAPIELGYDRHLDVGPPLPDRRLLGGTDAGAATWRSAAWAEVTVAGDAWA